MQNLLGLYQITKVDKVIVGGSNRQSSLKRGLEAIAGDGGKPDDIVMIHDGVRPLVDLSVIHENICVAAQYGCAVTAHPVTESVIITSTEEAGMDEFKKRADTYSITAPQTFQFGKIMEAYGKIDTLGQTEMPLLDAAMVYAGTGGTVHLVKEQRTNIKITTPEDYYFLKAILELEEHKNVFGV